MADIITAPGEVIGSSTEDSLEARVNAILEDEDSPKSSDATPPKGETSSSPGETAPSQSPSEPSSPPSDDIDKKLEEIKDETPEEDNKPKLSAEQEKILSTFTSPQEAEQAKAIADDYSNFARTFQSGQFAEVEGMFEAWDPASYDGFKEFIYQKYVASGEWVDRWVKDKEGNPAVNAGLKALAQKQAQLEAKLNERREQEANAQQEQAVRAMAQKYVSHIEGLFDQIDFNKADRRWVANDIHSRVNSDPAVAAAVRSGNMTAVNKVFKAAVREFVQRDKAVTQEKEQKLGKQAEKKLVAPTATASPDVLDDDINNVPPDQRESWFDRQLEKLKSGKKKK